MELSTTTEYKIAPQGTLQAFFTKVQDMSPYVRVVDTNDPFFMTLGLKARAFAKWAEDKVAFVELEVITDGDKAQTFTFTPAAAEPQAWDPALVNGKREFQYRWRVGFEGRAAGDWSKPEKTTTRNLNVAVETPGKLNVDVNGVGLDFDNVLDAVLVHLRYEDTARNVPMAGQSVLIAKDRPSGNWTAAALRAVGQAGRVPGRVPPQERHHRREGLDQDRRADPEPPGLAPQRRRAERHADSRRPVDRCDPGGAVHPLRGRRVSEGRAVQLRQPDGVQAVGGPAPPQQPAPVRVQAPRHLQQRRRAGDRLAGARGGPGRAGRARRAAAPDREGDRARPRLRPDAARQGGSGIRRSAGHREHEEHFAPDQGRRRHLVGADPQGRPRYYRYKIDATSRSKADPVVARLAGRDRGELVTVPRYAIPKIGADFSPVLLDFTPRRPSR